MADVQWIKIKVGMFDGESFKKIKRAKIGGESFRDKLTAVWFELMDFAGKCNHDGAFINSREIPFNQIDDIAIMIDREPEELRLCMQFYINEGMVEITNDVYLLSNWQMYQNTAGLEKIREQKRIAQAKWREKKKLLSVDAPVDSTVETTDHLPSISISYSNSISSSKDKGESEREKVIPYEDIRQMFNTLCPNLPQCRTLSKGRKEALRRLFKSGVTMDTLRETFRRANVSDFLQGKDGGWRASFDWLIKEANLNKVLEGNYDNRNGSKNVWGCTGLGDAELEAIQRVLRE